MPAPREGYQAVSIAKDRVAASGESDELRIREEWDGERKVGLETAGAGDHREQDDREGQQCERAVPPSQPCGRGDDAEADESDRDGVLQERDELDHRSPQAAPRAAERGTSATNTSTTS